MASPDAVLPEGLGDLASRYDYNRTLPSNASFPLLDPDDDAVGANVTEPEATTRFCTNEYCIDDEEYIDMILDYLFPKPFEWCLIAAYAVVFVIGLVGNFLVCFAVWRNRSMRTVTNYFIVNLAIADFLVVLICLPPTVLEDIYQTWYMERIGCKVVKYLQAVTVCVSVLTLCCISVERYYAICRPLKFKATAARTRLLLIMTWVVAIVIVTPELVALDTFQNKPDNSVLLTSCRSTWTYFQQTAYQIFQMIAFFILPFVLMFAFYIQIARCLWSTKIPTETSRDQLHSDCSNRTMMETQLLSRRKVAKMLIAVVVMFGICYLPVHLLNIFRYTGTVRTWPDTVITTVALLAHWLCYFNSAINPVIYNFMSTKFRREFVNACVRCYRPKEEQRRALANRNRMLQSYRYSNVTNHNCAANPGQAVNRPAARFNTVRV